MAILRVPEKWPVRGRIFVFENFQWILENQRSQNEVSVTQLESKINFI